MGKGGIRTMTSDFCGADYSWALEIRGGHTLVTLAQSNPKKAQTSKRRQTFLFYIVSYSGR